MAVIVLDSGNAVIKGKTASRETAFPHALRELTEVEYQDVLTRSGRAGAPLDYLRVNGKPYVVGTSAERHGVLTRKTGAARYEKEYYGVFLAAMLVRLYERGGDIDLYGSHPPGDVAYRDDLMAAALGNWEIEAGGAVKRFRVAYANTFDEPLGGLMNVILSPDGQHYARTDINGGRGLVIDVGGNTTDWLAVNPGGEVDYSLNESIPVGILEVLRDFERSFRANNRAALKDVGSLPAERVRAAIRTGEFKGGGRAYGCHAEVSEAVNVLVNRIANVYQQRAGGGIDYDTIVLTGGGAGMIEDRLREVLNHPRVILADKGEDIHLANVRGGLKHWRLLEANDLL